MQAQTEPALAKSDGRNWQLFLIAVAAAYSPLTVWANAGESPVLATLFLAFILLFSFGLLLWSVLIRLGLDRLGAAYAVVLFEVVVTNTGVMVGQYHSLDRVALLLLAVLLGALAYRLRNVGAFRLVMTWASLFLLAYPVTIIIGQRLTSDDDGVRVDVDTHMVISEMSEQPDVLVVVFDGYASLAVLEEFYGFDNNEVLNSLSDLGFYAPGSITANYARTQLSIPSFLQMEYVTKSAEISESDIAALGRVLNGESRMVEAFRSQGYRHIYVESGWLGSQCSSATVDVCIGAPWPDETFFDVSYRTILRGLTGFELGRSFTEGALQSADWLMSDLSGYLNDDTPDFIFAHVLLPHPPLFVDGSCVPNWRDGQQGFAIGRPDFDPIGDDNARDGYVHQVECANTIALRIARQLAPETAAIFVGDHGPDGQGQLFISGTDWNEAQRRERFGAFFVARVPGCDMTGIAGIVNVGRRTMSCLTNTELPDLPLHIYDLRRSPDGNFVSELEIPNW